MFVGHGLVAFALVALLGHAVGWSRERTLSLAVLALAFGTLPDVDMAYGPVGLLGGSSGAFAAAEAFWQAGNLVHRAATHSLLVGTLAAVAFGCWAVALRRECHGRPRRAFASLLALSGGAGLVAAATWATGGLAGLVMGLFVLAGFGIATVAVRRGVSPVAVAGTAALGLLTHPFGDLFTGEPPALLYPLDVTLVAERVVLHPDPTLHLLGAFGVELATVWLAAAALARLYGVRLRDHVHPRAALGTGYAVAAVALPAPTLAVSYHFVFSVLALGVVGPVSVRTSGSRWSPFARRPARAEVPSTLVTGLAAVTLGGLAYAVTYLAL